MVKWLRIPFCSRGTGKMFAVSLCAVLEEGQWARWFPLLAFHTGKYVISSPPPPSFSFLSSRPLIIFHLSSDAHADPGSWLRPKDQSIYVSGSALSHSLFCSWPCPPQARGSRSRDRRVEPEVLLTAPFPLTNMNPPSRKWSRLILVVDTNPARLPATGQSSGTGHGSLWKTRDDRNCLQAIEEFIFVSMWCCYSLWPPPERSRTGFWVWSGYPLHTLNQLCKASLTRAMLLNEKKGRFGVRGLRFKPWLCHSSAVRFGRASKSQFVIEHFAHCQMLMKNRISVWFALLLFLANTRVFSHFCGHEYSLFYLSVIFAHCFTESLDWVTEALTSNFRGSIPEIEYVSSKWACIHFSWEGVHGCSQRLKGSVNFNSQQPVDEIATKNLPGVSNDSHGSINAPKCRP